ncbi:MAG TPA: TylF/MycF/NovP-related O-methyltransferase [Acidimicrobiales bacterium]|nr:TylF/MycF/NovP-related O-methyltransferase [Acidimicrobiales bacterium]
MRLEDRYVTLLINCLTRTGFGEPQPEAKLGDDLDAETKAKIDEHLRAHDLVVVRDVHADPSVREEGRDWPPPGEAETMIGLVRARHLAECVEQVVADDVPGDLLEAGVWRGGSCILMRGVLEAFGDTDRCVWVADSFEGLPKPDAQRYPADEGDDLWTFEELAISLEQVQANFARYGLLDDRVRFLKGWFEDTLPTAPVERLSLLRVDGDLYSSTTQALESLYPKLSPGGWCIVDDYGAVPACRAAVDDFRYERGVDEPIEQIDWTGVAWRRR